jgi:hypothetical protein
MLHDTPRRRLGQSLVPIAKFFRVPIQGLAELSFLVAEGGIEARRVDTHRSGQVGDGRPLISRPPKHFERPVERKVGVEFPWTS